MAPALSGWLVGALVLLHGWRTTRASGAHAWSEPCPWSEEGSARRNDGFCDCADGTDEPMTAACAHVVKAPRFRCKNEGHVEAVIAPSRVGDGVCDCCDGSDETDVSRAAAGRAPCDAKACEVLAQEAARAADAENRARREGRAQWARDAAEARVALLRNVRLATLWDEAAAAWREVLERHGEEDGGESADAAEDEDADAVARRVAAQWVSVPGATDADLFAAERADADAARDSAASAREDLATPAGLTEAPPVNIPDPTARRPAEWDEEEDGEWEVPTVDNPAHQAWLDAAEARRDSARTARERSDEFRALARDEVRRFRLLEPDAAGAPDERERRRLLWRLWPYARAGASCPTLVDAQYTYEVCVLGEAKQDSTRLGSADGEEVGAVDPGSDEGAVDLSLGALADATAAVLTAASLHSGPASLSLRWPAGESGFFCGGPRTLSGTLTCGASPRVLSVREPERCTYLARLEVPALCFSAPSDASSPSRDEL